MGSICDKELKTTIQKDAEYSGSKYDPKVIEKKFNNYIFKDNIIDLQENKYKLNDPVFQSINNYEKEILSGFYKSKKEEFQNNMAGFLNKQNLDFVSTLTKQIIENEDGREKLSNKLISEIQKIKYDDNDNLFNKNYLSIMIVGITGV